MMTSHSVYSLSSAKQWKFQDHGIYSGATKKGREWVLKELKATMGFAARVRQMTEDNKAHAQIPSGLAEIKMADDIIVEMEDGINRSLRMQTLTGLQNCVFDEAKALF